MRKIVSAALALSAAVAPASAQQMIQNGGFEAGFSSWGMIIWGGSSGNILPTTSTTGPQSGLPQIGPKSGTTYALTDQNGPGAYAIAQTFHLNAAATSAIFSFSMSVSNWGAGTFIGSDFYPFYFTPNQYVSVDLFAGTPSFSFATASLMNFFQGSTPGGPNPYVTYTFDVTSLLNGAGDYTIRFAEVDNQGTQNMAVDDVSLTVVASPEPASLMLLGTGLLGVLGVARRRRI